MTEDCGLGLSDIKITFIEQDVLRIESQGEKSTRSGVHNFWFCGSLFVWSPSRYLTCYLWHGSINIIFFLFLRDLLAIPWRFRLTFSLSSLKMLFSWLWSFLSLFLSMFLFSPPREHCFIYSCEFGMFLGGQHPVASPPATRTCLYFYAYFNAEFSMCVFIWFFYVLNSTLHKGIRCCVKNN